MAVTAGQTTDCRHVSEAAMATRFGHMPALELDLLAMQESHDCIRRVKVNQYNNY